MPTWACMLLLRDMQGSPAEWWALRNSSEPTRQLDRGEFFSTAEAWSFAKPAAVAGGPFVVYLEQHRAVDAHVGRVVGIDATTRERCLISV